MLAAGLASGAQAGAADTGKVGAAAAARMLGATVRVKAVTADAERSFLGLGHGVAVGPRRVVTALHVARAGRPRSSGASTASADAPPVALEVRTAGGARLAARVVARWPALDLALLETDAPLDGAAAPVAPAPRIGTVVVALRRGPPRLRAAHVRALYGEAPPCRLDLALGLGAGTSGAGVFDRQGRLVAIVSAAGDARRTAAVPVAALVGKDGRVRRAAVAAADLHPACRALRAAVRRSWPQAEREARAWAALLPRDGAAWLALARAVAERDPRAAVAFYRRAAALLPDEPEAWALLAVAHAELGQPGLATVCLLRALRIAPEAPHTWMNLAILYLRAERWHDAYRAARRATQLLFAPEERAAPMDNWGDRLQAWRAYGLAAFEIGWYAEALEAFSYAIPMTDGQDAADWVWLARAAFRAGDQECFDGDTYAGYAVRFLESLGEREAAEKLRAEMAARRWPGTGVPGAPPACPPPEPRAE